MNSADAGHGARPAFGADQGIDRRAKAYLREQRVPFREVRLDGAPTT